jgi:3-dehydroquinate synthase
VSHVLVYGPPGVGKSTVGKELAAQLELPFVDLDRDIEQAAGRPIPDLMAEGEGAFRDVEAAVLQRVLARSPSVVALGGGTLLSEVNRRRAEDSGQVVCLDADEGTLRARLDSDDVPRPLVGARARHLSALLAERRDHYDSFAVRVRVAATEDERAPASIARDVLRRIHRLHVHAPDGRAYDVVVRSGALDALGAMMRERQLGGPVVLIADETVAGLYAARSLESLRRAGFDASLITFPAGEGSKTLATLSVLWQGMLDSGLDRASTVVALGGGVTGDLAGFAAATFMRGIDWVAVPTTLLAMVDASIGGKTGVDLPSAKNLAGCFHHPRLVVADPDTLDTLPQRELNGGMAEVVKHSVIGDPGLLAVVERGWPTVRAQLEDVVGRALAVKIAVVEEDPQERGQRAVLNLGHTIGHAVEVASGYELRHGEAVAIGLVAEATLAESLDLAAPGVARRIGAALASLGLPTAVPGTVPPEAIARAMATDKKRTDGAIRFALPVAIGEVRIGIEVGDPATAMAAATTA